MWPPNERRLLPDAGDWRPHLPPPAATALVVSMDPTDTRHEADDDLRREAIDQRRQRARVTRCKCTDDVPGRCPGPRNCSYGDDDDE